MTSRKQAPSYRIKPARVPLALSLALLLLGPGAGSAWRKLARWEWQLPPGYLAPWVPEENPMSPAKVELGRHLFYDVRLSGNRTQSCATCHRQELAFTDGLARALGSTGQTHPRGTMSLVNVAYVPRLTWADPALNLLEEQALIPLLGRAPVEMGLSGAEARFLDDVRRDPRYRPLFLAAFPEAKRLWTMDCATAALAAFQRALISFRSPYDRYRAHGEEAAISASAKRGELLFFSGEKAGCFQCHGGILFGGAARTAESPEDNVAFHNTGLYNLPGADSYPAPNRGLFEHTRHSEDTGRFRAPTLRNIAVTAPYMHDGSIATLEEVLDHYSAGGRTIASGPYAGHGSRNPNKSAAIHPLSLTAADRSDLIAFLHTLTDAEALRDPRWANPWPKGSPANP